MILVCFFLMAVLHQTEASEKLITTISILKEVEINKEKIRLGDVADIQGDNTDEVEKLKNIFIGRAPLPGKTRRIDNNYVVVRLKQNDVDFSQIQLKQTRETLVLRGFTKITKDRIGELVSESLPTLFPFKKDQFNIKKIEISDEAILPKGKFTYKITPPPNTDFLGNVPLSVFLYVDGEYQKRIYATLNVELLTNVVIANRPLRRNYTINEIDIKTVQMDMANLPSNAVLHLDDVIGKKLTHAVSAGTILRTDLLDLPPLVNRNDIVLMIAESDNFKITAIGESQDNGNLGERIKVLNLDSKKEVYAKIVDSNSVKIDF